MMMMTDGLDDSNDLYLIFSGEFFGRCFRHGIGSSDFWLGWVGLVVRVGGFRFSLFLVPRHVNLELRQLYSLRNHLVEPAQRLILSNVV